MFDALRHLLHMTISLYFIYYRWLTTVLHSKEGKGPPEQPAGKWLLHTQIVGMPGRTRGFLWTWYPKKKHWMLIKVWVLREFWCPFLQTPAKPPSLAAKEGNNSAHCAADISLGGSGSSLSSCVSLFISRPRAWISAALFVCAFGKQKDEKLHFGSLGGSQSTCTDVIWKSVATGTTSGLWQGSWYSS